jgi:hypothetical protein
MICVDREVFPCRDLPRMKCSGIRDDEGPSDHPSNLLKLQNGLNNLDRFIRKL